MEEIRERTVRELATGICDSGDHYQCVVCGTRFEKGLIYRDAEMLREARSAALRHVASEHGGMVGVLVDLPASQNGLTEVQRTIVRAMSEGASDRDIARRLGGRSESTVRNHRFQMKKRFLEARILTAIAEILDGDTSSSQDFVTFHADIPADDERIVTTVAEAQRIASKYLNDGNGLQLLKFPRKEKEKLVVLRRIAAEFTPGSTLSEKEVNAVLESVYPDYVTIRRYLVDYRFLSREPDGSEYRVHE